MAQAAAATPSIPHVDSHLLKFSQGGTVLLSALAFILQQPILVAVAAACLLISAAVSAIGPFRLIYRGILVPLHILKPRIVEDDPAPHRFAQAVGATFLIAATVVFYVANAPTAGWVLDLIVFVLSTLNFTVGFCAGCFVYYQLGRIGLMPRVRYAGGFHWRGV